MRTTNHKLASKVTGVKLVGEDGESIDANLIASRRAPHPYEEWIAMRSTTLRRLARDKGLPATALRLYLELLGVCGYENLFQVSQGKIAQSLGVSRASINSAWAALRERKLIEPVESDAFGSNWWRINPHNAWKGRATRLKDELAAQRAQEHARVRDETRAMAEKTRLRLVHGAADADVG